MIRRSSTERVELFFSRCYYSTFNMMFKLPTLMRFFNWMLY